MSRKERLLGAGVLTVIGVSSLAFPQFPGLGLLYELRISNVIALPYIVAALCLISALVLFTYISPEEHLWGSDDPGCEKDTCHHIRH
jgi:hypothetical protein